MASDDLSGGSGGIAGAHVNCTLSSTGEAERIFDALAEGGTFTMPIEETFWSPLFGISIDRFGVGCMVNVEPAQEG